VSFSAKKALDPSALFFDSAYFIPFVDRASIASEKKRVLPNTTRNF
jgi:hypothetical protein